MTDQDQPDQDQLERAFEYYPRLRELKRYAEEHPEQPLTLEDAARLMALEPKYFSALFKKTTGISFTEWNQAWRVRLARELLANENVSVGAVSKRVGFSSERTFYRAFKARTGLSPFEYRSSSRT